MKGGQNAIRLRKRIRQKRTRAASTVITPSSLDSLQHVSTTTHQLHINHGNNYHTTQFRRSQVPSRQSQTGSAIALSSPYLSPKRYNLDESTHTPVITSNDDSLLRQQNHGTLQLTGDETARSGGYVDAITPSKAACRESSLSCPSRKQPSYHKPRRYNMTPKRQPSILRQIEQSHPTRVVPHIPRPVIPTTPSPPLLPMLKPPHDMQRRPASSKITTSNYVDRTLKALPTLDASYNPHLDRPYAEDDNKVIHRPSTYTHPMDNRSILARSRQASFPTPNGAQKHTMFKIPKTRNTKPFKPIIIDLARSPVTIKSLKCRKKLQTSDPPTFISNSFIIHVSLPTWHDDPLFLRRDVTLETLPRGHTHPITNQELDWAALRRARYAKRAVNYTNNNIVGVNVLLGYKSSKHLHGEYSVDRSYIRKKALRAFRTAIHMTFSPLIFCDIVIIPNRSVLIQSQSALVSEARYCLEQILEMARSNQLYKTAPVLPHEKRKQTPQYTVSSPQEFLGQNDQQQPFTKKPDSNTTRHSQVSFSGYQIAEVQHPDSHNIPNQRTSQQPEMINSLPVPRMNSRGLLHIHPLWIDTSPSAAVNTSRDGQPENQITPFPAQVPHFTTPRISPYLVHDSPLLNINESVSIAAGTAPLSEADGTFYSEYGKTLAAKLNFPEPGKESTANQSQSQGHNHVSLNGAISLRQNPLMESQVVRFSDCYTTSHKTAIQRYGMTMIAKSSRHLPDVTDDLNIHTVSIHNPLYPLPAHRTLPALFDETTQSSFETSPLYYMRYPPWKLLAFEERNRLQQPSIRGQSHETRKSRTAVDNTGDCIGDYRHDSSQLGMPYFEHYRSFPPSIYENASPSAIPTHKGSKFVWKPQSSQNQDPNTPYVVPFPSHLPKDITKVSSHTALLEDPLACHMPHNIPPALPSVISTSSSMVAQASKQSSTNTPSKTSHNHHPPPTVTKNATLPSGYGIHIYSNHSNDQPNNRGPSRTDPFSLSLSTDEPAVATPYSSSISNSTIPMGFIPLDLPFQSNLHQPGSTRHALTEITGAIEATLKSAHPHSDLYTTYSPAISSNDDHSFRTFTDRHHIIVNFTQFLEFYLKQCQITISLYGLSSTKGIGNPPSEPTPLLSTDSRGDNTQDHNVNTIDSIVASYRAITGLTPASNTRHSGETPPRFIPEFFTNIQEHQVTPCPPIFENAIATLDFRTFFHDIPQVFYISPQNVEFFGDTMPTITQAIPTTKTPPQYHHIPIPGADIPVMRLPSLINYHYQYILDDALSTIRDAAIHAGRDKRSLPEYSLEKLPHYFATNLFNMWDHSMWLLGLYKTAMTKLNIPFHGILAHGRESARVLCEEKVLQTIVQELSNDTNTPLTLSQVHGVLLKGHKTLMAPKVESQPSNPTSSIPAGDNHGYVQTNPFFLPPSMARSLIQAAIDHKAYHYSNIFSSFVSPHSLTIPTGLFSSSSITYAYALLDYSLTAINTNAVRKHQSLVHKLMNRRLKQWLDFQRSWSHQTTQTTHCPNILESGIINLNGSSFTNPFPPRDDETESYRQKRTQFQEEYARYAIKVRETPQETSTRLEWERQMNMTYPHIHFRDGILVNIDREIPSVSSFLDYTPLFQTSQQLDALNHELLTNDSIKSIIFQHSDDMKYYLQNRQQQSNITSQQHQHPQPLAGTKQDSSSAPHGQSLTIPVQQPVDHKTKIARIKLRRFLSRVVGAGGSYGTGVGGRRVLNIIAPKQYIKRLNTRSSYAPSDLNNFADRRSNLVRKYAHNFSKMKHHRDARRLQQMIKWLGIDLTSLSLLEKKSTIRGSEAPGDSNTDSLEHKLAKGLRDRRIIGRDSVHYYSDLIREVSSQSRKKGIPSGSLAHPQLITELFQAIRNDKATQHHRGVSVSSNQRSRHAAQQKAEMVEELLFDAVDGLNFASDRELIMVPDSKKTYRKTDRDDIPGSTHVAGKTHIKSSSPSIYDIQSQHSRYGHLRSAQQYLLNPVPHFHKRRDSIMASDLPLKPFSEVLHMHSGINDVFEHHADDMFAQVQVEVNQPVNTHMQHIIRLLIRILSRNDDLHLINEIAPIFRRLLVQPNLPRL